MFKFNKNAKESVQPNPNIYEWYFGGFQGERASDSLVYYCLFPQDAPWLHIFPQSFCIILRDIYEGLFSAMDVVMEIDHQASYTMKERGDKDNILKQYARWRNAPGCFFMKENIIKPQRKSGRIEHTTKLLALSKGIDLHLLDEYLYQISHDYYWVGDFMLHVYGAPHSGEAEIEGETLVEEIKQRHSLEIYLHDWHPTVTFKALRNSDTDDILNICKQIVEKHGGIFKEYPDSRETTI